MQVVIRVLFSGKRIRFRKLGSGRSNIELTRHDIGNETQ